MSSKYMYNRYVDRLRGYVYIGYVDVAVVNMPFVQVLSTNQRSLKMITIFNICDFLIFSIVKENKLFKCAKSLGGEGVHLRFFFYLWLISSLRPLMSDGFA